MQNVHQYCTYTFHCASNGCNRPGAPVHQTDREHLNFSRHLQMWEEKNDIDSDSIIRLVVLYVFR
jgi:hypothetical protein